MGEIISIIGMLNGMLGGTILVVPLLGKESGYLMIPVVTLYFGLVSWYCTYLLVYHLGDHKSIAESFTEHFNGKLLPGQIFNVLVDLAMGVVLIIYFQLACKQVEGFVRPSPLIGIITVISLFFLTLVMRKYEVGDRLLALGFLSIIMYIFFISWALITAPSGPNRIVPASDKAIDLAAAMLMAFTITVFIDRNLTKNVER